MSRTWHASARSDIASPVTATRAALLAGGYDRVHFTIDDATRLAYVEVFSNELQATSIGSLSVAVAWFNDKGFNPRDAD